MSDRAPLEPGTEIRGEVKAKLEFADRIIAGNYGSEEIPGGLDPHETFSGPILDLEDDSITEPEIFLLHQWVTEKLGSHPDQAPVVRILRSPDNLTTIEVYGLRLADGWYISKMTTEGKQPTYIFWPEDVYDWQMEAGYREI